MVEFSIDDVDRIIKEISKTQFFKYKQIHHKDLYTL